MKKNDRDYGLKEGESRASFTPEKSRRLPNSGNELRPCSRKIEAGPNTKRQETANPIEALSVGKRKVKTDKHS